MLADILTELIGPAPDGLEWLAYLGEFLLVFFGLAVVLIIILKFFSFFDREK